MPVVISGTNGITNATWTTATRPSAPSTGQQGYNTTIKVIEVYTGTAWIAVGDQTGVYTASYLVVAGGGGGGNPFGVGGSAVANGVGGAASGYGAGGGGGGQNSVGGAGSAGFCLVEW